MRPKGKLFALFAVFAAIGLVTASGAFTTVTAERTADVNTAGDADALLAIQPGDGSNGNNGYAQQTGDGTIELSLDGDFNDQGAAGVNNNATTEVDNVINITNQGTQEVNIYIERTGSDHPEAVTFFQGDASSGTNITASDNSGAVTVDAGNTTKISMTIDTTGTQVDNDDELLSDITIHANATSQ